MTRTEPLPAVIRWKTCAKRARCDAEVDDARDSPESDDVTSIVYMKQDAAPIPFEFWIRDGDWKYFPILTGVKQWIDKQPWPEGHYVRHLVGRLTSEAERRHVLPEPVRGVHEFLYHGRFGQADGRVSQWLRYEDFRLFMPHMQPVRIHTRVVIYP